MLPPFFRALLLFRVLAAASGAIDQLDFSQAHNSEYVPLIF